MSCGVDALPLTPISLDELVRRAALQARVDRKYVLPIADAELVAAMLPRRTRVLEIDGRRSFAYASVYFDTPARDAFLRTAYRRRRRFKVRTRAYGSSGSPFLEVKTRHGALTVKERLACDVTETLSPAGLRYIEERLACAGVEEVRVQTLAPAIHTSYHRSTLLPADGNCRVTFDSDLRFSTVTDDGGERILDLPSIAIVETKTVGHASSVDRLLWSLGVRPVAVSKFATGLAALHPEFPRTRWARLIRTRLTPSDIPPTSSLSTHQPWRTR